MRYDAGQLDPDHVIHLGNCTGLVNTSYGWIESLDLPVKSGGTKIPRDTFPFHFTAVVISSGDPPQR